MQNVLKYTLCQLNLILCTYYSPPFPPLFLSGKNNMHYYTIFHFNSNTSNILMVKTDCVFLSYGYCSSYKEEHWLLTTFIFTVFPMVILSLSGCILREPIFSGVRWMILPLKPHKKVCRRPKNLPNPIKGSDLKLQ